VPISVLSPARVCLSLLLTCLFLSGVLAPGSRADLPANGRAWEMMTQIQSSSSSGVVGMRPMFDDDERVVYAVIGPPPGSPSGSALANGIAVRGPSGWLDTPLGFAYETESPQLFTLLAPQLPISFSEDLQTVLWASSMPLTPGAPPAGEIALYRERGSGPLELIAPVGGGLVLEYPYFAGVSGNGATIVFGTPKHLLPADSARTTGGSVYAWKDGALQLVDVDDGGSLLSTCGSQVSSSNGLSASGGDVFLSLPASCNGTEKVYLRNLEDETTTEISASHCTRIDCNAPANVSFAGANRSGSVAYMTTTQQLTDDDEDSNRDLYRYDAGSGELSLVSGGSASATGAVDKAVVFPAEVGDRVYFTGSGELLPGEPGSGAKLFVVDAGGPRLVAEGAIPTVLEERQLQETPDGGRALFVTAATADPGDTDSQLDAYLYDAGGESLTRISTGPSGGNGAYAVGITGPSPLNQHEFESGNLRPYYAIDDSGERAFFTTEESLVPEDTNAKADVYEYWHGTVDLVSPGYEPYKSDFAGISRDGRSAMFATNANLVPSDRDGGSRDVYAARIGGGFPEEAQGAACDSSSCPLATDPRLAREAPPSLAPQAAPHVARARLRLLRLAARSRRGEIVAVVSAVARGRVTGTLWSRGEGRRIVLAHGTARVRRPGRTRLALRLTEAGSRLSGGLRKAHLTIRQRKTTVSRVVRVKLG
jgi:hypothetical protein